MATAFQLITESDFYIERFPQLISRLRTIDSGGSDAFSYIVTLYPTSEEFNRLLGHKGVTKSNLRQLCDILDYDMSLAEKPRELVTAIFKDGRFFTEPMTALIKRIQAVRKQHENNISPPLDEKRQEAILKSEACNAKQCEDDHQKPINHQVSCSEFYRCNREMGHLKDPL